MRVRVSVRDKQFDIQVGDGSQSLQWLANAALCRFDSSLGMELGPARGVRLEDGTQLPLQGGVAEYVQDGAHLFVVLQNAQQSQGRGEEEEEEDDRAAEEGDDDAQGHDAERGDDEEA